MPNNLINKIISFTTIIFLSGGCIPFSKETPKDNLPDTVSITLPESSKHFVNRFPENYAGPSDDSEFFNVNQYEIDFNQEKTVVFEHGKHTFKIPHVSSITAYEDGSHNPFLGVDEFDMFSGLGKSSNISDEEARQNFYNLIRQMHQAGWTDLISRSAPRIKHDRKNAAAFFEVENSRIKAKPIIGIPAAIELTPEEWKKLPNLAQIGTLYAEGVLVEFMLGKDNSEQYRDQYGNGQYALQITVKAYWDFLRLHVQEEFGKPGYREALDKELRLRAKERKQMEDKARAEGFEIDESYQDPPVPPLIALPRDGSR